ncbi:hypothetical protein H6CHR_05147 [Variovorax sp. PBL-H6]|uniref:hypothetical protein n=1 Tax=Variovorax sp. PBL-H6 TaxID=434009 RepID=UPI0013192257|nr:hypothetical protein [Variovorax sp. PBL-H6]VTU38140.1 hypothetical protein H6CHR_05147 [Variovorax sp. PBL-H6]
MQPHPHTVFVNRPARLRSRVPQLLFSATLAIALLAAMVLLGYWEVMASPADASEVAWPAATEVRDFAVPAASEVLRNAEPVPDEAVATF